MPESDVKVIVFDYDGTLVDSNEMKMNAYRPLFPEGRHIDQIVIEAIDKFPCGPRFEIIEYVLRRNDDWSSREKLDREIQRLSTQYDEVVTAGAINCREMPFATQILKQLSTMYPVYLLSVTLESSLKHIISRRNWDQYFKDIIGYPQNKVDALINIAINEMVPIDSVLMVGDGEVDRESAQKAGSQLLYLADDIELASVCDYLQIQPAFL